MQPGVKDYVDDLVTVNSLVESVVPAVASFEDGGEGEDAILAFLAGIALLPDQPLDTDGYCEVSVPL